MCITNYKSFSSIRVHWKRQRYLRVFHLFSQKKYLVPRVCWIFSRTIGENCFMVLTSICAFYLTIFNRTSVTTLPAMWKNVKKNYIFLIRMMNKNLFFFFFSKCVCNRLRFYALYILMVALIFFFKPARKAYDLSPMQKKKIDFKNRKERLLEKV